MKIDLSPKIRTFREIYRKVTSVVLWDSCCYKDDGRLAVGRVGGIFEQLEELNSQGFDIILVSSGAVGAGRQRLKYRRLINSSFADLQKPQVELDGKACAAVGQNSLMALYDSLFSQLDVTSSQLLVTDNDFKSQEFRVQLSQTVNSLLALRSIPIFNENDAISTRRAPYADSSGIFWDNDSLAALLALELKADLLVLLSDVDGLYSGPPIDPRSKLIHTYVKEKHEAIITFGDKSRVGRGGMNAKVRAAISASRSGTPVIIASGFIADNITKVLSGERVGTLFHKDAHSWLPLTDVGSREMAIAARECSRKLQSLSSEDRAKILFDVADALEANESLILAENVVDVSAAENTGYDKSLVSRLALKPGKISALAKSMRTLAEMEEPIGQLLKRMELADGLILEKRSCPLGVLLVVFESRPDALVQIASLAIRSGNGLLLKGGKEAMRSNAILYKVITAAIPDNVGQKLIGFVTSRDEIADLLQLDDVIDLVIPRGSNNLVSQVKNSTKIPVLGHSDGICHVYVDKSANIDMAKHIVLDAKTDYPAACNAMETLLVHNDLSTNGGLQKLAQELQCEGVTLYGGPRTSSLLDIAEAQSFHHEYSSRACTIETVSDVFAAIDHIHKHGRHVSIFHGHTECIVTEDSEAAELFLRQVDRFDVANHYHFTFYIDSAAVFHNASTRFCDGARFGLGAEVGISTSRIHARGQILRGSGQVVDGDKGVNYTHKNLSLE
ncbi:Delta-1-pyrroline-5-carboxylate synthase 1 [Camellia lanceoleosa]|uniref:Delta-1-pyrroline-5-carboxylate synthase 1 n=1 Tax=Camellia lanceoleosa TaxID=1840588 RepID=A0ACC0G8Y4_9ERIC|nr:Delta-1-pyrroline-5-carboxylate synthase 1 [Camellia lanceoleosa]